MSSSLQRASNVMPDLRKWVERLSQRISIRSQLPMSDGGLKPRFSRVADVYEFSEVRVHVCHPSVCSNMHAIEV